MHATLDKVTGLLFAICGWMSPVLQILFLALLFTVVGLVVFRLTSNQDAIRRAKGPMKAHLLGMVIFRHDLRQVFRAVGLALWASVANVRFMLVPLLVMIVPLGLIFVRADLRLGYRGFGADERFVLRVHVREGGSLDDIGLAPSAGLEIETPGVRVADPARGLFEVDFGLKAAGAGEHEVRVLHGGGETVKRVVVGLPGALLSPARSSAGILDRLLTSAEDPLPVDGPVTSVEVRYPAATYEFLGIEWAWWMLLLVFMIPGLFLLRGLFGVDF